jgi:CRISPR-associated protein Cmr1
MTVITATYRIVTPMFLGGADQKATSLRPPSVKGALLTTYQFLITGQTR